MTDRGAIFGGIEAPPPHLALDLASLSRWLGGRIDGFGGGAPIEAAKFRGGQSNPTYLLSAGHRRLVLRRRPPGKLLESAHAIDREYRVLGALAKTDVPVPRVLAYCEDDAVIGSAFYLVEYLDGQVCWDAEIPDVTPAVRSALYDGMNAAFARLHALDPVAVGLGDLGRAGDYCARNFARWSKVYRESRLVAIPDMDWLMEHLPGAMPREETSALLHGDYGLYNLIVDRERAVVLGVLDWEMATLGDPFVDLAHHLRAWWDLNDDTGAATSLRGRDLVSLGIPSMDAYVATYCARRGVGVPDMGFYFAYAQFRYAAMVQGILKRAQDGTSSARKVLHTQDRVAAIAAMARRTFEERLT